MTERVAFLTLTAPGNDVHVDKRTGRVCECTPPGGVNVAWWNGTKTQRWTHFLRDLRRMLGEHDDMQYGRGVEAQRRGALHDHVLVRCRGDLVARKEAIRKLAIRHGFGHEIDLRWARPGDEWYLAKYVSASSDERAWVEWLDASTGEVTLGARCRTWTASRRWGLTMCELKRQQAAWIRQAQDAERRRKGTAVPDAGTSALGLPPAHGHRPLDYRTGSYAPGDAIGAGATVADREGRG